MNIIPVILAGGTGSRLWPLSRQMYPKQFYPLLDEHLTMLQQTCNRMVSVTSLPPVVVCNEVHRFIVSEQLRQIGIDEGDILLEPVGRDSAAGISVAAHHVAQKYGQDAVMVVLPADHHIGDLEAFASSIQMAVGAARQDKLIVFGIKPNYPETGYGYIHSPESADDKLAHSNPVFAVNAFKEKPDIETATAYVQEATYFWNSGMFVFTAKTLLTELVQYEPDIVRCTEQAITQATIDLDFIRLDAKSFELSPKISIDYALMEKSQNVYMVPLSCDWSDVGSWKSLWSTLNKDEDNNASQGDCHLLDTHNSLVISPNKTAVLLGLKDVVVIDTKDALMVANINHSQQVKAIVERFKNDKQTQALTELHREVYRPWGVYDAIDNGERYQVKRITVKAGQKLSVQMHHHRAEHWIVVSGTAKVVINDEAQLLTENQSVYIPIGAVHSLENPGKIPLELIEVQSGGYLGEDDIVRFEDVYGRTDKPTL